ncbi:MAG TPA: N(4)-(beta-N-acetylglucosaminyl)-L-asparaginase [Fimbriimonadaceae bacterium]|nr:N(4)-(beta-N-acetylglucosaminyl)-L-asparaginase [Fimbriimonadaceae bacterium]
MATILASWRDPGQTAVEVAWQCRQQGGDLLTSLEKGLAACELDPRFLAIGLGSLPNQDGDLELDASIMDGADLSAGAVCSVRGICPVISVARMVKEKTPHVMLAGDQARRFAIENGMEPMNLMTAESVRRYDEWRVHRISPIEQYVHSATEEHHGDTVTMLGWEEPGHVVAASSTSGLSWKLPGRVGDSPIVGAGIYADDEVGCAGATGLGEELWKGVVSFRAVEKMRHGMSPQQAADDTIYQLLRRQPGSTDIPCVVFCMNNRGEFGAATTKGEFPLWICEEGDIRLQVFKALS